MAKKIRFPLQMNGADVRTIEELRENFDLESVLGYFANGKLVTWLKDRYYDNEAMAVEALSAADGGLNRKLMSILGVPIDEDAEEIDIKTIQRRIEKLMLLRQITDDKEVIDNVDCVVFNQDELNQLLKEGKKKIYLCQGEFEIPICEADVTYTGISNPIVSIVVDDGSSMKLGNVVLNHIECTSDSSNILLQLGMRFKNGDRIEQDYSKAIVCFENAAKLGNAEAQWNLGQCYVYGKGVEINFSKAAVWFCKAAEQGHARSKCSLGWCYEYGKGVERNLTKAIELYHKSAAQGCAHGQNNLGYCYEYGEGVERNLTKAVELYHKAAAQGDDSAQANLGLCYEYGKGVERNLKKAVELYHRAAAQGNVFSQEQLKRLGKTW